MHINVLTSSSALSHTPAILYTTPSHIEFVQLYSNVSLVSLPTPPYPTEFSESIVHHTPINNHCIDEHITQRPRIG